MPLLLPNLDDRRWSDLVDESLSLIPFYAPEWTDHNIHDPGITLIELLSYLAEMDIYQLNRIPDSHKLKFMDLVGVIPKLPIPATTVLSFSLIAGSASLELPPTVEFIGQDAFGEATPFQILKPINIALCQLQAIQIRTSEGFCDVTERWSRDEDFAIFGDTPYPGAELYLGFDKDLPVDEVVSLFFVIADSRSGLEERNRIIDEAGTLRHHSVNTIWEFFSTVNGLEEWLELDVLKGEVCDDTRSFTLNGDVRLKIPAAMTPAQIGEVSSDLYYIRCRIGTGVYDAPPVLRELVMNGVMAEQAASVGQLEWDIAAGAAVNGTEPNPGDIASFTLQFDEEGEITQLTFVDDDFSLPKFLTLDYQAASPTAKGSLIIEADLLGTGTGEPLQELELSESPVISSSLRIFTLEDSWQIWTPCLDFDSSKRTDSHFLTDATQGIVEFGDGERGRTVPSGIPIIATYQATRAKKGNISAQAVNQLSDSPHNQAILNSIDTAQIETIVNPVTACGGADAETLTNAAGRVIELMNKSQRAVTLDDYEALAMETPGTRLARVKAIPNHHPDFPCFDAPGIITLVILPHIPASRPEPSRGLRRVVTEYLCRRRVIGTRFEVVGPTYLEIAIHAKVRAHPGTSKTRLQQRIVDALDNFLDPLKGGPDGSGWPFGRDIYRSEILQLIDEIQGVDHVLSLEFIPESGCPQCGNVKLCPSWLISTSEHQIEVM